MYVFGVVVENQQPNNTWFSTIQHLESHHVPTSQLRIEILHRIWYLDGKLCATVGMFKLAIRNQFNTTAAAILYFVFRVQFCHQ